MKEITEMCFHSYTLSMNQQVNEDVELIDDLNSFSTPYQQRDGGAIQKTNPDSLKSCLISESLV